MIINKTKEYLNLIQKSTFNHLEGCFDVKLLKTGLSCKKKAYPAHGQNLYNTGTGLKMLYQTADVLNGMNKEKLTVTVDNRKEDCGTEVCIFIPANYKVE